MVFRSHVGSILVPIWEPFGISFGVKIDPRSVQDALPSLIFVKNTIFTEPLQNKLIFMMFDPKIDPKTAQVAADKISRPAKIYRVDLRTCLFINIGKWPWPESYYYSLSSRLSRSHAGDESHEGDESDEGLHLYYVSAQAASAPARAGARAGARRRAEASAPAR